MSYDESDCRACRSDFPALSRKINGLPIAYFDGPGGTQVPGSVIEAIAQYYRQCNANTHGKFVTSEESDRVIQAAREAMATMLGAPSWSCISFGANMTTLNFSLSRAIVRDLHPGDEIVITALDHEANRGPWLNLRERGVVVREVALRPDGTLDGDDMAAKVGPRTRVVAVGWASNALGTVNDVALARELSRRHGAWLVVDAVHFAPHFPIDVVAADVDFLLCSAYKFYGPHVGVLYARPSLLASLHTDKLRTQDDEAPFCIETGTLNHAALAGVTAAVEYRSRWGKGATLRERLVSASEAIAEWEHSLARRYYDAVTAIPAVRIWGPGFDSGRRAPTVSITVDKKPAKPAAEVAAFLGSQGLAVWDGHFYAARAVEVLGVAEQGGLLRTGMSMYNTLEEVDRLVAAIAVAAGA